MYNFKIGIPGWSLGENSFGVTKPYLEFFSKYGTPVILCPSEGVQEDLDLLVLPGGADVSTHLYGQVPQYYNSNSDQFKEFFMLNNLPKYIDKGIPVFGICLGHQELIVHFGGSLSQDIGSHPATDGDKRWEQAHDLIFTNKFAGIEASLKRLYKKDGKKNLTSNSLHHQGAFSSQISNVFDIVCHTKDDVVEVIQHKELPIVGVQFHPEEDANIIAQHFIKKLLKKSPNYIKYETEYKESESKALESLEG